MPSSLLARIDGVVSEMERELTEEERPSQAPARGGAGALFGSGPLHRLRGQLSNPADLPPGEVENTIDWLDKQIYAIEERREACEMRQAHLAELRKLVSEGQTDGTWSYDGAGSEGGRMRRGLASLLANGMVPESSEEEEASQEGHQLDFHFDNLHLHSIDQAAFKREFAECLGRLGATPAILGRLTVRLLAGSVIVEVYGPTAAMRELERLPLQGNVAVLGDTARVLKALREFPPGRLSILERDHLALKKQVSDLEVERSAAEAERLVAERAREELMRQHGSLEDELRKTRGAAEEELRRARGATEAARDRIERAEHEARALKEHLREAEALLEAERQRSSAALEARQLAEANLQTLEDKSRDVLHDCRSLQAKVLELEAERAAFATPGGAAAVNSAATKRILELEQQLADERGALSLSLESGDPDLAERLRISESANAELHELRGQNARQIAELERDLVSLRVHHEQQVERSNIQTARVVELESLLGEKNALQEHHEAQQRLGADRIKELEEQLRDALASQAGELERRHEEAQAHHLRQLEELRGRHGELEQQLRLAREAEDGHSQQSLAHRNRLTELEQLLQDKEALEGVHTQQHAAHRTRIQELEEALDAARAAEESQGRQATSHRTKLEQLESQLEDLLRTQEEHYKQSAAHRARVSELEQELLDVRSSEENQARQNASHKQRIQQLQADLAGSQAAEVSHQQRHHDQKLRVTELEERLHELELGEESRRTRVDSEHQSRVAAMEEELRVLRDSEALYKERHTTHSGRITDLEQELQQALDSQAALTGKHGKFVGDLESRLSQLEEDLKEERVVARGLKQEMLAARAAAEEVQRDCQEVLTKQDELIRREEEVSRAKTIELDEVRAQLEDLQRRVEHGRGREAIEAPLASAPASTPYSTFGPDLTPLMGSQAPLSTAPTSSVPGSRGRDSLDFSTRRRAPRTLLLPRSTDPFVEKVRNTSITVAHTLTEANDTHAQFVKSQLGVALEAYKAGRDPKASRGAGSLVADDRRRTIADALSATVHELRALREEAPVQHQLTPEEVEEINDCIAVDIQRCEAELRLLAHDNLADHLPEGTLHALMNVHDAGRVDDDFADGFTPMHWAAQNGRRDVVEYLRRLDGGPGLLNARDVRGRSPLYYAQAMQQDLLVQHLLEAGADAAVHSQAGRPDLRGIPEKQVAVVEQVEIYGWKAMNWREGYTILHWAADKGYTDLCRYLVHLDADPAARDGKDRTPVDMALEAGKRDTMLALEELLAAPKDMAFSSFQRGSDARRLNGRQAKRDRANTPLGDVGSVAESSASSSQADRGIPEAYLKVMEKMDQVGWENMKWARGFTLLHWASKNNHGDLCAHFMFQRADPNHCDDHGRSAFDYAMEHSALEALEQLRRGPPLTEPKLLGFAASRKERGSDPVISYSRNSFDSHRASIDRLLGPGLQSLADGIATE